MAREHIYFENSGVQPMTAAQPDHPGALAKELKEHCQCFDAIGQVQLCAMCEAADLITTLSQRLAEMKAALAVSEAELNTLRVNLTSRDDFIVAKGLWSEFVARLALAPEARQTVSREEIITALKNLTTDEGPDQAQLEKARGILAALDQVAIPQREGEE